jgi:hypothetical protein
MTEIFCANNSPANNSQAERVKYVINKSYSISTLTLNMPRGVIRRIYAFYWLIYVETNKHIIFCANNA